MLNVVGAMLVILVTGLVMRTLHQPSVVGYLLAGIILGPQGLSVVTDQHTVARLGEIGVVLLLFFVGMEVSPHQLIRGWRITFVGTVVQIGASVGLMWGIGTWLDWPVGRIILLGFVISLSSTAVLLNYLQERNELDTKVGRDVLGVLLAQDLFLIPMLIAIGVMSGGSVNQQTVMLQLFGAVLVFVLVFYLVVTPYVHLPLARRLRKDHELQVFAAAAICMGFALVTGLFQLSTALGAFVAGMLVGVARETNWVHHRLEPFRIVFLAAFFVSIGILVDLKFIADHWWQILLLVVAVLVTNNFVNTLIFRLLGDPWRSSLYAGALLAQIGEFSFVLAAVGHSSGLINDFAHQLAIAVIALSLLLSPAWIAGWKRALGYDRAANRSG